MLRLKRLEVTLWVAGAMCAGYLMVLGAQTAQSQRVADKIVAANAALRVATDAAAGVHDEGRVIGRIDIPALKLSAPITADYDADSLRHGVGHIRGTAMPGGLGTVGLAGHRDSFFRPLRQVAAKMEIRLSDKSGTYRYTIDSTEIVTPENVQVLDVGSRPELTLVTCFPFDYMGAAPKRFIVHAHLLSAAPDSAGAP